MLTLSSYNFLASCLGYLRTLSERILSMVNSAASELRRSNRTVMRKRASLIITLKGRAERLPCLVVDSSQGGLKLLGSFRLKRGQVVEVIWDADPSNSVRYRVIWTGNPGSKREGEAGLETV